MILYKFILVECQYVRQYRRTRSIDTVEDSEDPKKTYGIRYGSRAGDLSNVNHGTVIADSHTMSSSRSV